MEISTKTHLKIRLNVYFSTSYRVPITWPFLPCLAEREWRVSLLLTLLRDEKTHSGDKSIEFSQRTSYWISIRNKCLVASIKFNDHLLRVARWNARLILFQISDSIFCATRIVFCLPFLNRYDPFHRSTNSTTNLVHRTTVHTGAVKGNPQLGISYCNENKITSDFNKDMKYFGPEVLEPLINVHASTSRNQVHT